MVKVIRKTKIRTKISIVCTFIIYDWNPFNDDLCSFFFSVFLAISDTN